MSARARRPPAGCGFVPPYLLMRIIESAPEAARSCTETLALDRLVRDERMRSLPGEAPRNPGSAGAPGPAWTVYSAGNTTRLPGRPVRSAGDPESGDAAVDEAAYGGAGALALFEEVYGRDSYDDAGATVRMTVHYGRDYNNAFWNGSQLVFGDGDGRIFERFTRPVDVLGHELTHAVTEYAAGLAYRDQPGALNESMSDVFATCARQRMLGQRVDQADWLIGKGLFRPGVNARALRDMAAPGTAYDDPRLGRDPQVGHLDDYVETDEDNGGVHLNSGIPNKAFHLAATRLGGTSWDGAGAIWYAALTSREVGPRAGFAEFAAAAVRHAGDAADVVAKAWSDVGVGPAAGGRQPSAGRPAAAAAWVVEVRRSGGFTGLTSSGRLDLATDDPRIPEVRELLARVRLEPGPVSSPQPDRFVYSFRVAGGHPVEVAEQDLSDDLRRLAEVVLGEAE